MRFYKEKDKLKLPMEILLKLSRELLEIREAQNAFLAYAREIPGYINKSWEKRNQKAFRVYKKGFIELENKYGKDTIKYIVISNTINIKCSDKIFMSSLMRNMIIHSFEDYDYRYFFSEDEKINNWNSIIYLMMSAYGFNEEIPIYICNKSSKKYVKGQLLIALPLNENISRYYR